MFQLMRKWYISETYYHTNRLGKIEHTTDPPLVTEVNSCSNIELIKGHRYDPGGIKMLWHGEKYDIEYLFNNSGNGIWSANIPQNGKTFNILVYIYKV